jgi:hypothetical protein
MDVYEIVTEKIINILERGYSLAQAVDLSRSAAQSREQEAIS